MKTLRQLKYRAHEWLADHVTSVQYPNVRADIGEQPPSLYRQYRNLSAKQRAWVWFFIFWGAVIWMAVLGQTD